MKIGIIDSDFIDKGTRFPNLALMKISKYYKKDNNTVELTDFDNIHKYDMVFISKVFNSTHIPPEIIDSSQSIFELYPNTSIFYGGSGFYFDKAPKLPNKIEHIKPDYHLYDNIINEKIKEERKSKYKYFLNFDIGFTTRGCFRQCDFCINKNYEKARRHSKIEEFMDDSNSYISLLDDNVFAHNEWDEIFYKLNKTGKRFEFNQGLDIRLMTEKKAKILSKSNYYGDYIFAFDDLEEKDKIINKTNILDKYSDKQFCFYVLSAYKSQDANNIKDVFERIRILMKLKSLPYIMRYKKYKDSKFKGIYITLARWCNQHAIFKKKSFREFCNMDGNDAARRYMKSFENSHSDIASKYFDLKWENY